MSTRTDALVSQQETGKMTASIIPVGAGCHPARGFQTLKATQRSSGFPSATMPPQNGLDRPLLHANRKHRLSCHRSEAARIRMSPYICFASVLINEPDALNGVACLFTVTACLFTVAT